MNNKGLAEAGGVVTAASAVIDLCHLDQYTLGDQDLQRELLELFRMQLDTQQAELRQCADPDAWKRSAHTLKGAARAVGAFQVADVAERMEDIDFANERDCERALGDLGKVREAFEAEFKRLAQ